MTEAEVARLNDALEHGLEAIKAGRFRPAREAIADLRHRLR
jgi:predicted transcriptional regulator